MKSIHCPGCVHVTKRGGDIVSVGGDTATRQISDDGVPDEIIWIEPTETMTAIGVRETRSDVAAWRSEMVRGRRLDSVESMKTETAYREKSIQAREIIAGATYDAAVHDFIAIEVVRRGVTALVAAQDIIDAVRRDALALEDERVALRELLRSS